MVHVCGIGTPSRAVASVINIVVLVGMVWCICLFSKQWACLFIAHLHKVCDNIQTPVKYTSPTTCRPIPGSGASSLITRKKSVKGEKIFWKSKWVYFFMTRKLLSSWKKWESRKYLKPNHSFLYKFLLLKYQCDIVIWHVHASLTMPACMN